MFCQASLAVGRNSLKLTAVLLFSGRNSRPLGRGGCQNIDILNKLKNSEII